MQFNKYRQAVNYVTPVHEAALLELYKFLQKEETNQVISVLIWLLKGDSKPRRKN